MAYYILAALIAPFGLGFLEYDDPLLDLTAKICSLSMMLILSITGLIKSKKS